MRFELKHHMIAYTILILLLTIHILLFMGLWPQTAAQRIIAVSLGCCYFFWGILAHVKSKHITKRIAREYFFAALLGSGILIFITL